MLPAYRDGDAVLVDSGAYSDSPPEPGDVVLVAHPFRQGVKMIKRVDHVTTDGKIFVVGDNRLESTDSRTLGPLRPAQLIGRVIETSKLPLCSQTAPISRRRREREDSPDLKGHCITTSYRCIQKRDVCRKSFRLG